MMFKKSIFLVAFLFVATYLTAQDQKFSAQINTGYTWFSGAKPKDLVNKSNPKSAYGTFTNGQIPVEVEFRYRFVSSFAINLAYAYGIGMPYNDRTTVEDIRITNKTHLSSHGIRLGGMYYFKTTEKLKPYVGLDLAVLISQITNKMSRSFQGVTIETPATKSNTFANFALIPKIGLEYNVAKQIYINAEVHDDIVFPSNITMDGVVLTKNMQAVTNGIGIKVGVGFRF